MKINKSKKHASSFDQFWHESEFSLYRSTILMHRLIYDLQFEASKRGYLLDIYKGEVDHAGFDIILDDRDTIKKIQVKTVSSGSRTSSWEIHRAMLRPDIFCAEKLGFESSPEGVGYQGGVILMDFKLIDCLIKIDYYYLDIFILQAFNMGVLTQKKRNSNSNIKTFSRELQTGKSHQKIKVRKSVFVKSKGPGHLLSLAGLQGSVNASWPCSIFDINERDRAFIADELRKMIDDKRIGFCSPP